MFVKCFEIVLENAKSEKRGRTSVISTQLITTSWFYPQSSITMFSFDLLFTKSWHKRKWSLCRAVKEGKQRKHEDFFWKDA